MIEDEVVLQHESNCSYCIIGTQYLFIQLFGFLTVLQGNEIDMAEEPVNRKKCSWITVRVYHQVHAPFFFFFPHSEHFIFERLNANRESILSGNILSNSYTIIVNSSIPQPYYSHFLLKNTKLKHAWSVIIFVF